MYHTFAFFNVPVDQVEKKLLSLLINKSPPIGKVSRSDDKITIVLSDGYFFTLWIEEPSDDWPKEEIISSINLPDNPAISAIMKNFTFRIIIEGESDDDMEYFGEYVEICEIIADNFKVAFYVEGTGEFLDF